MQIMDNEGCKAIVEIVIDLARKLGLRSVAEGSRTRRPCIVL